MSPFFISDSWTTYILDSIYPIGLGINPPLLFLEFIGAAITITHTPYSHTEPSHSPSPDQSNN